MTELVSDIQEKIKTIKMQKQMMKNNRKNDEDELEASINMLDNFKSKNNYNSNSNLAYGQNLNLMTRENDSIQQYYQQQFQQAQESETIQEEAKEEEHSTLYNGELEKQDMNNNPNNPQNIQLFSYSNNFNNYNNYNNYIYEKKEEEERERERKAKNNYLNSINNSTSQVNTVNTLNSLNSNAYNTSQINPYNNNKKKEYININDETEKISNNKPKMSQQMYSTSSSKLNSDITPQNKPIRDLYTPSVEMQKSKYQNILNEFEKIDEKEKEGPTLLKRLGLNNNNVVNSKTLKNNHSNLSNLNNFNEVGEPNKLNSQMKFQQQLTSTPKHQQSSAPFHSQNTMKEKSKSFLSKAEEKQINFEQRKNEKKAELFEMLSISKKQQCPEYLHTQKTNNQEKSISNQEESQNNPAFKVRNQIKSLVSTFDNEKTHFLNSHDKPKLLQKLEGRGVSFKEPSPTTNYGNIKLTDPVTLLSHNNYSFTNSSKNRGSKTPGKLYNTR